MLGGQIGLLKIRLIVHISLKIAQKGVNGFLTGSPHI
jgi:hypothetical protein